MTNLRQALKIDNEEFQDKAGIAEKKIKTFILGLMKEAEDDIEQKAILGAMCAAYASMMILFKPDEMDAWQAIESGSKALMLTGLQMLEFDEAHLVNLEIKTKE